MTDSSHEYDVGWAAICTVPNDHTAHSLSLYYRPEAINYQIFDYTLLKFIRRTTIPPSTWADLSPIVPVVTHPHSRNQV
ncbi:hypothetical protein [Paenibacillus sp. OK003]|uniref:hypothetical protein n=1 Tax=Paenibacillus sp. OK003 TaxID=1884380 RepID=UPI0011140875|nr:hypothetical protein [Paenibacillus sp. OK003]